MDHRSGGPWGCKDEVLQTLPLRVPLREGGVMT